MFFTQIGMIKEAKLFKKGRMIAMKMNKFTSKIFSFLLTAALLSVPAVSVSAAGNDSVINELPIVLAETDASITFSADTVVKGTAVTVTASCKDAVSYAFYFKKSSSTKWTTVSSFSSSSTATVKPTSAVKYDIKAVCKLTDGTTKEAQKQLNVVQPLSTNAELSSDYVTKGQSLKIYARGAGGVGTRQYQYSMKKSGSTSWKIIEPFGSSSYILYKTTASGTYDICVKVKDERGVIVKKNLTLTVAPLLVNNCTVSSTSVNVGSSITINTAASGGSGGYTYAYKVKSTPGGVWGNATAFSSVSTMTVPMNTVGTYQICAMVQDSNGKVTRSYFNVECIKTQSDAEKIVSQIISSNMTAVQKVRTLHDWVVKNTVYDTANYNAGTVPAIDHTAEGVFKNHTAVCDGYSYAFQELCEAAGIQCNVVTGFATNNTGQTQSHAWNQIIVNGTWYNVDVTWDDPVIAGVTDDSNLRYTYFMVPNSVLAPTHKFSSAYKNCTAAQPKELERLVLNEDINSRDDCYYAADSSELKTAMQQAADKKQTVYDVIVKTGTEDSTTFINNFFNNQSNFPKTLRSINVKYMSWKFDGYTIYTFTVTYA